MGPREKEEKKFDVDGPFEELLRLCGDWSWYQLYYILFFTFICAVISYLGQSSVLVLYPVPHHCALPLQEYPEVSYAELKEILIPKTEDGKPDQCNIYVPDEHSLNALKKQNNSAWSKMKCPNGWVYDTENYFTSAIVEFDWVCEDSWKPVLTQGIFALGGTLGTFLFGWMADNHGRYWAILFTNGILLFTGIGLGFTRGLISFSCLRFLMGLSYPSCLFTFHVLVLEYIGKDKRSLVGNLCLAIGFSLGGIYEPFLLKAVKDWRIFHHVLFAQLGLTFIMPFFIDESCRWLMEQKRFDEMSKVFRKIAKRNGRKIPEDKFLAYEKMIRENGSQEKKTKNVLDLFRYPVMRKRFFLLTLLWSATTLIFDAHIRNIENLEFSIIMTFTIGSIIEFPADIMVIFFLEFLGRRMTLSFSHLVSGIFMFIAGFLPRKYVLETMIVTMTARFFMTFAINSADQYMIEIYPTEVRALGIAVSNIVGQLFTTISSSIVYSSTYYEPLPFVILGVLGIVAAIFPMFLPETTGLNLPGTLEESESFGKNQSFFYVPGLASRKKKTSSTTNIVDENHVELNTQV